MPKLTCPAGHVIDLSAIPNPRGYVVILEAAVERIVEDLERSAATTEASFAQRAFDALSSRNPAVMHAYACPGCGRVAVFAKASDAVPVAWYAKEPPSSEA